MSYIINPYGFGGGASAKPLDAYSTNLTAAWSMSRQLLSSYGGTFYTDTSGTVSIWHDQSGTGTANGKDLVEGIGTRPAVTTQGGITVANFTPDVSALESPSSISTMITATTGYMVFLVYMDGHRGVQSIVYRDTATQTQVSVLTSTTQMSAYNDGGATFAVSSDTAVSGLPCPLVMTWRHEGGVLYAALNGGTEASASSGNTGTLGGKFRMSYTAGLAGFDGKIYEAYVWSTPPSSGDRTAIVNQAKTYLGI